MSETKMKNAKINILNEFGNSNTYQTYKSINHINNNIINNNLDQKSQVVDPIQIVTKYVGSSIVEMSYSLIITSFCAIAIAAIYL